MFVYILCCNAQLQNRNYGNNPQQQERAKQILLQALAQHTTTLRPEVMEKWGQSEWTWLPSVYQEITSSDNLSW